MGKFILSEDEHEGGAAVFFSIDEAKAAVVRYADPLGKLGVFATVSAGSLSKGEHKFRLSKKGGTAFANINIVEQGKDPDFGKLFICLFQKSGSRSNPWRSLVKAN